jgi:hypothetical protein
MNRRVCACIGLVVGLASLGLLASAARGQAPQGQALPGRVAPSNAGIPINVKNAPDATSFRPVIQQFIQGQITALTGEDPAAQKAAREKLAAECAQGSSASYLDVYAHEINSAVLQLLDRKPVPPLRVRLNLAVLVEAVGRTTQNSAVQPAVIALMNDPAEAVALWGMKAAKHVVIAVVQNPVLVKSNAILPAIVSAVKSHPEAGFVAAEAYDALIPEIPGMSPAQIQALLPPLFDPILDVLTFRVSLYQTGIPDNPEAERLVASFFKAANFAIATPAEQHRIIQQLVNLVVLSGEQAPFASSAQLSQIIEALQFASQDLIVISGNSAVTGALLPLTRIAPGTPGSQVAQRTKGVFGIMQTTYQYLQAPPAVIPATTAPTTSTSAATARH